MLNFMSDARATFLQHENRFQMGDSGPLLLAWGKKVPTTNTQLGKGEGESLGGGGGRVVQVVVIGTVWGC